MDLILKNAKSVAAFILVALAQAITDRINTGQALPSTANEWGRFLGVSLVASIIVWLTGNKLDAKQINAALPKLNVPQQVEVVERISTDVLPSLPVSVQSKVAQDVLTEMPDKASDAVVAGYPKWISG